MKKLTVFVVALMLLSASGAFAGESTVVRSWDSPLLNEFQTSGTKVSRAVNLYNVWIGAAFAASASGESPVAVSVFSSGESIALPIAFFVPYSGNWETNWVVTDQVGTIVYDYYSTVYIPAQTVKAQLITISLSPGYYTFTAAVLNRDMGTGAISNQYRFDVE